MELMWAEAHPWIPIIWCPAQLEEPHLEPAVLMDIIPWQLIKNSIKTLAGHLSPTAISPLWERLPN